MVYYNYVVDSEVVEERIPYPEVLARTGLVDQVGLTERGYVEYFEPQPEVIITQEMIAVAVRNMRDAFLQKSDWTQTLDAPLTAEKKTEWATYRQALRDMPETFANATTIAEIIRPTAP